MTQPPIRSGALRGAVDLSGLGQNPAPAPAGQRTGQSGNAAAGSLRVDGTDATFQQLVAQTRQVAALVVLWSSAHPETQPAVDAALAVAAQVDRRLRVIAVDVQTNPGIAGAFQAQQVPMTIGLIGGQPVPLFAGIQPAEQLRPVVDELLRLAAQNGVTERVPTGPADGAPEPVEDEVPAHIEAAFQALERGDFATAAAAYEQALQTNPADAEAAAGLAQVRLLERTAMTDPAAARAAAAADPKDIDAQLLVADLDLVGGHVEDAFARLVDLVRVTTQEDRAKVREHLVGLFEVVGSHDPRVVKARRALMSALF